MNEWLSCFYNIKQARIGIAIPEREVALKTNKFEYWGNLKAKFMELIYFLVDLDILIDLDCNQIPRCMYTEEEKQFFKDNDREFLTYNICGSILDRFADGTTSHCFATELFDKKIQSKFNSFDAMFDFYQDLYMGIRNSISLDEKCSKCPEYMTTCFSGCLSFRIDKVEEAYNRLLGDYAKSHGITF